MRDERSLRRDGFDRGVTIRLADRQYWNFPTPEQVVSRTLAAEDSAQYRALTRGIVESESRAEILQAELALSIFLLGLNYDLAPPHCFAILAFSAGDPGLREFQEALHGIAMEHVRARRIMADAPARTPSQRTVRRGFLGRVRAAISA